MTDEVVSIVPEIMFDYGRMWVDDNQLVESLIGKDGFELRNPLFPTVKLSFSRLDDQANHLLQNSHSSHSYIYHGQIAPKMESIYSVTPFVVFFLCAFSTDNLFFDGCVAFR